MLRELLLNMLYPNRCSACDELLEYPKTICKACRQELERLKLSNYPEVCPRCHRPEGCICDFFEKITGVRAPFVYEGGAKSMVVYAKTHNSPRLFDYMGSKMAEILDGADLGQFAAVTYVPATAASMQGRGFNQTQSLAEAVSTHLKLPLIAPPMIRLDTSLPQHQLAAGERRINAESSYLLADGPSPLSGSILLVDDIVTTGATLEQCASLLLQAGAERVYGLCFATALLRGDLPA